MWVSRSEIQGLWKGAQQLSTRRAVGVDPKGGHLWPFPVGRLEVPVDWGAKPSNPQEDPSFPQEIHHPLQSGTQLKSDGVGKIPADFQIANSKSMWEHGKSHSL